MGHIIYLDDWRKRAQAAPTRTTLDIANCWQMLPVTYVESVLMPSITLWRTIMASYACWWLAPVGLEVRPVARASQQRDQGRLTSTC